MFGASWPVPVTTFEGLEWKIFSLTILPQPSHPFHKFPDPTLLRVNKDLTDYFSGEFSLQTQELQEGGHTGGGGAAGEAAGENWKNVAKKKQTIW